MRIITSIILLFITTPLLALDDGLDALLAKLPNSPPEVHRPLVEQLAVGGEETLGRIVELVKEPGKGDDRNARYALHALARHAGSPGSEQYRQLFTTALQKALSPERPALIRAFLIEQSVVAGRPIFGPSNDEKLNTYLRNQSAERALHMSKGGVQHSTPSAAVPDPGFPEFQRREAENLQVARLFERTEILRDLLGHSDQGVRISVRRAMAMNAKAEDGDILLKGLHISDPFEQRQAIDAVLLFARRLTQSNQAAEAEKIYRHLMTTFLNAPPVQSAALHGLAQAAPNEKTLAEILKAVESEHLDFQAAAMEAGKSLPGRYVTRAWLKQVEKSPPEVAGRILELLAARGDPDAFEGVLGLGKHSETVVRHAAMRAAAALGGERAVPVLIEAMKNDGDRSAAREALARAPGKAATVAIAYAIPQASPPAAKAALLNVLAARNAAEQIDFAVAALKDENAEVRAAAASALGVLGDAGTLKQLVEFLATGAKADADREAAEQAVVGLARLIPDADQRAEPVAAALAGASDMANRAALLRALGRLGGAAALPAIRDALKSSDPQVRDAGVRALANWPSPDESALGDLSGLARSAENNTHRVLALRAYLRLAGTRQLAADKRLAMYRDGLALAKSAEDKRLALSGLADLGDVRALPLVSPLLEDADVQQEAAAAVVRVTRDVKAPHPEAKEVLKKVLAVAKDERVRRDARSRLSTLGGE